jgi:hypothetical protein
MSKNIRLIDLNHPVAEAGRFPVASGKTF